MPRSASSRGSGSGDAARIASAWASALVEVPDPGEARDEQRGGPRPQPARWERRQRLGTGVGRGRVLRGEEGSARLFGEQLTPPFVVGREQLERAPVPGGRRRRRRGGCGAGCFLEECDRREVPGLGRRGHVRGQVGRGDGHARGPLREQVRGDAGVDPAAFRGPEVVVQRDPHDRVGEVVAVVGNAQHVRLHERVEGGVDGAGIEVGELGHEVELVDPEPPERGQDARDRACLRSEVVEAVQERAATAERGRGVRVGEVAAGVVDDEPAGREERSAALLDVERVALGGVPERVDEAIVGGDGQHGPGDGAHVLHVERADVDHGGEAVTVEAVDGRGEVDRHVGRVDSHRGEERHRRRAQVPHEQREHGEGVGVGHVEVVDGEHGRVPSAPGAQELLDGVEHAAEGDGRGDVDGERRPETGLGGGDGGLEPGIALRGERGPDRGPERGVRQVAVELVETALEHDVAEELRLRDGLGEEARLPDPGLAPQDDRAGSAAARRLERLDEELELGVATDEGPRHRGRGY